MNKNNNPISTDIDSNNVKTDTTSSKKKLTKIIIFIIVTILICISTIFIILNNNHSSKEKEESENSRVQTTENDSSTPEESFITPLLYQVTKEGSDNVIYLFGSIHVADKKAYPLPDKVMTSYKSSDYLAVEFDIIEFSKNFQAQMEMVSLMMCEPNKTLKDYMHPTTYEMTIKYLKDNNIYNSMYESYRPVMIYSLISNEIVEKGKLSTNKGIDDYFLKTAKKDKKQILEVESSSYQYNLLASFPDELFEAMILSMIVNEEEGITANQKLYEAWLKGDEQELVSLSSEEETLQEDESINEAYQEIVADIEELLKDYENKLIYNRNETMTETIEKYFAEEKNVFFVVGCGHIVGEKGIASTLKEKGYKVEKITY